MVNPRPRLFAGAVLTLLLTFSLSAKDWTDYQPGDAAEQDIVTPVSLTVVDADATAAMKQKEAAQVPLILRLDTSVADSVEERFRQAFKKTRSSFLSAVQKAFGRRTLNPADLQSIEFQQLVETFQKKNKQLFPLDPNRAALWASGDTDQAYEESLAGTLRKTMTSPIRSETLPFETKSARVLRLVPLAEANGPLSPAVIEQTGTDVSPGSLVSLTDARQRFQELFVAEERPVGKFLATLLAPNCAVDPDATQQLRVKRTEGLLATDHYAAGQVLAHRGEIVDKKVKAALDLIREKVALGQLQLNVPREAAAAPAPAPAQAVVVPVANTDFIRWLLGGLVAAVLLLVLAVWQLARRRQPVSLLPVPARPQPTAPAGSWEQRALAAEERADKAREMMKAGVLSQMARWLSDNVVRRLISDRRQLLDTQQTAVAEIAALAARLEKIHAPLQDRLLTYERRIAELEKELAAKGAENRELIRTKIEMIRKQLEAERGKNRVELN
jgi:hypothetical protein